MIAQVEKSVGYKGHLTAYFNQVSDWTTIQQNSDKARTAFKEGMKALDEIGHWFNNC